MSTKKFVLAELKKNIGTFISGAELANTLNLSRTAVWKAINCLKNDGYKIESSTNKGYSLTQTKDELSYEEIQKYLSPEYSNIEIVMYDEVTSTNNIAKQKAISGTANEAVIISDRQTAGRGRLGRSFFSPEGTGIYMSMILTPGDTIENSILITVAVSVAVARAIEKVTGKYVQIKWVNDLYYNNKKICGILTEAVTNMESSTIENIITGIGINYSTGTGDFPSELKDTAGSLFNGSCSNISRNKLIAEIINNVIHISKALTSREYMNEYRERSYVIGKRVNIIRGSESISAKVMDIDNNGCLIAEDENHNILTVNSGEVSIRTI